MKFRDWRGVGMNKVNEWDDDEDGESGMKVILVIKGKRDKWISKLF